MLSDCASAGVDARRAGTGVVVSAAVVWFGAGAVVVSAGVVSTGVVSTGVVSAGVLVYTGVVVVLTGTKTQPSPSRLYMPSGQRAQKSLPVVFL